MAMFRTLVAVVFGAERLAFAAESKSKMIVHNLGKEDLGIYFLGAVRESRFCPVVYSYKRGVCLGRGHARWLGKLLLLHFAR